MPLPEAKLFRSRPESRVDESHRPLVKALLNKLGEYMDTASLAEIDLACEFGAQAHEGQTRQSGEAYISHPVAVAGILGEMRMDSRTIVAAILHDVVEDTPVTLAELSEKFGEDVALLVDGVSKVSQLELDSRQNPESAETASFRKMFMAMAQDIRVIIIKLCDRLHNMRTLGSLKEEKRQRIAKQTLDIYAPIANRIGMRELSTTLEDLSLQNLHPKRYRAIKKMLDSNSRGRKSIVDEACLKINEALGRHNIIAEVGGREKTIYSIYRKAKKQLKIDLRDIADINALRVITDNRNQCYLVLGIIHTLYKPRPASFKDYIAIPKANGYQSLHTSVFGPYGQPVEVQIRSRAMHRIAESGVASHWRYKTDTTDESAPQQLAQKWLSSFLESQQMSSDSGEFIEHLKADLYPDEVYVFTPKGDIKRLPRGATALDFAYSVHTDIGNRCVGARVDNRAVPLYENLRNGNHIEIITSNRSRPEPGWLNYAVTSKARSTIRHYLNKQKTRQSVKLGQKLFKKALWDQGYRRIRIPSNHKIALLNALDLKDWPELLADIGFGKRLAPLVAKQFLAEVMLPEKKTRAKPKSNNKTNYGKMTIEGTEGLLVNYAKCCYPIPDDRIIGTTTSDKGLVIHRLRCANTRSVMKHPDQFFHLNWSENTKGNFEVLLTLTARNQPGVLSELTNIIASHDANINKLTVEEQAGNVSRMLFVIEVLNRNHLAEIMRELHLDKSVIKLQRSR
ncbi:MAG: bifunctional (p)ppGpp synthetase/guanosine-3',5'-bis(diphosphate) 3'-pyrophosphohydrolase [Acidiferrobacterales bacterium]|nr:bifunctional (p)ppGpp synthetase/guanosine-3',5'-bis(diphosphate) 3'-pyrophosphohydrolase [Acidiferrobacterales bacterium]